MTLEALCAPVTEDLQRVNSRIKKHLRSDNKFVSRLNEYITNKPGKMLRPALVLLSAKTAGPPRDKAIPVAAAVEMIHTATLIHDDVVDDSDRRRGQPTVNSRWNNGISIVLGDCWYSRAIAILSDLGIGVILKMLLEAVDRMCAGELEHLKRCYDLSFTEQDYLRVVEKKTACLMAFCCQAGALIGKACAEDAQALVNYGLNLGLAFQIVDDCMDMVGTEERTGKPACNDLSAGKITLPLIYALNITDDKHKSWLKNIFESRKIDRNDASKVRDIVKQSQAIRLCLEKAAGFRDNSKKTLSSLKNCESRHALSLLVDYVIDNGFESCLSQNTVSGS